MSLSDGLPVLGAMAGGPFLSWLAGLQRDFHRELAEGIRALTADGGGRAAAWLIGASFVYGVVHAAGPGHGKAVITTYLLTQREKVWRGVRLAVAAAALQGLVAIALIHGLAWAAGWLPRDTSAAVSWSERLSYLFVLLLGAVMVGRGGRALAAWRRARRPAGPAHAHEHAHDPDHDHEPHGAEGAACGCGHVHVPTAAAVEGARDPRVALGVILSIGLRPCSGAVLVLVFAQVAGLAWAGVAAVAAMSAGTALAIGLLAMLAVAARQWAATVAGGRLPAGAGWLGAAVACAGGLAVAAVGLSLLAASFAPAHPFRP
jgi:ABC-type nickel/cobalt efflux system permease component RcnA